MIVVSGVFEVEAADRAAAIAAAKKMATETRKEAGCQSYAFYADVAAGYADELASLGAAGCTYVQFDDTNLAYLCDERMREGARQRGDDPNDLPRRYARLINAAIAKRPKGMTVCVHLCRGNFKSAWAAEGGYEPVAEVLFNELAVDGYFLEYDDPRSGDFAPLRHVPKGKTVVLGLVSTKIGQLESKDELKRRIDAAAKLVPLEQLCLSPQCGFSSTVHGNDIYLIHHASRLHELYEGGIDRGDTAERARQARTFGRNGFRCEDQHL